MGCWRGNLSGVRGANLHIAQLSHSLSLALVFSVCVCECSLIYTMRTVGGVLISLPQAMTYPTTRNVGGAFVSIPQATSQVTKSVKHDRDDIPTVTFPAAT